MQWQRGYKIGDLRTSEYILEIYMKLLNFESGSNVKSSEILLLGDVLFSELLFLGKQTFSNPFVSSINI